MDKPTYVSLHNHTEYSNLRLIDSINRPKDLMDYAYSLGLKGVADTEHECLSAHVKMLQYWEEKYKDKDFKLILGNEIYIARSDLSKETYQKGEPFYHFILLAKDLEGYKQLRTLSSRAWSRGIVEVMMRVWNTPQDLYDVIKGGHVIASTACLGSYCGRKFKEGAYADIERFVNMMADLFGKGNFYVEIQPSFQEDQIAYNKFLIEKFWGKYPLIFTTDSHYLQKEDRELHKAFLNSKDGDREVDTFYSSTYMMSYDEVYDYLKDYVTPSQMQEMAQNSLHIADSVQMYDLRKPQVITKVKHEDIQDNRAIFDNIVDYTKYPYFDYYRHTDDSSDKYFFQEVANGFLKENVSPDKQKRYVDELEIELQSIREISKKIGVELSDYFTSMAKIIEIIWDKADSIIGPSRGSAGAFLINYLLGITQMNPLEQPLHMASWRFLSPDRPELPDIDFDTEGFKRGRVFSAIQDYFRSIGGDVYNICSFGTEKTKKSLQTAARGLKVPDEVVSYLGSMIPNERGFDWTLDQCYGGDEDHAAIKAFKEEIDQYPELWKVAHKIEGLITNLTVHPSGIVCVNGDFNDYNSLMKTKQGQLVSAYELHDSEACGLVKYDALTVQALDRIHQCMNYLLEDHVIDWQGSLKATYDKYLNPSVISYTDDKMWDMVDNAEITSLFQFDTGVGAQGIAKFKPRSLSELAILNAVMRLSCDGELPIDTYTRFKNDIHQWYSEMNMAGLTDDEVHTLEKYLLPYDGVAATQEVVMELSMDPKIAGFTLVEANKLRKTIAKKQFDKIDAVHAMFMEHGRALGNRDEILNYVWDIQIKKSLGYSFSVVHTSGYSILAIQEMNLARFYPIIYWNCACLSVDSSAIDETDFDNLLNEGVLEIDDSEDVKNKTDVNKIITSISRFKNICHITTPDINKSKLGFMPDADNNIINYGLKGITRITSPVIDEIMEHRPYASLQDFCNKVNKRKVTRDKIVNLIKAGCFNEIEKKTIQQILYDFILSTCDQKKRITLQNIPMLITKGLIPSDYDKERIIYQITLEMRKTDDDSTDWYFIPPIAAQYRETMLDQVIQPKIVKLDNGRAIEVYDKNEWNGLLFKPAQNKLRVLTSTEGPRLLTELNKSLFDDDYEKYAAGDEAQWELDSLNYYKTESPLTKLVPEINRIVPLTKVDDIIEGKIDGFFHIKNKEIPKMHLYSVIGTVLNRNTTKGLVTIQTPDGILLLKLYKDLFAFYNNETTTHSFFDKGTNLLVTGVSRGSIFIPKVYKNLQRPALLEIETKDGQFVKFHTKEPDDDGDKDA